MPGAADYVHVRQAQVARRITHRLDAAFVEVQGREVGGGHQVVFQPVLGRGGLDHLAHLGDHRLQSLAFQVTEVQGHAHFAGDHVARAGVGLQATDGAAGMGLVGEGAAVDRLDHGGGTDQGVLAQMHRGGAGVGLDAAQGQVEPLLAEGAEHHADGLVLVFEDRALFDMRLEVGADRVAGHGAAAGVADGVQCLADAHALGVALGQGLLEGELVGEHPRTHHARGEARAFLVGPHHHLQRRFGFHAEIIEGADHLQPGHHAEAAVELAAGGLGVDMAAGHHWRQLGVAPGAAGEDVADRVDAHRATGCFAPLHEQVAGLAIKIGQRQAAYAALGRGAEAGQIHQRLPQAVAVDVALAGLQDFLGGDGHGVSPQAVIFTITWERACPAMRRIRASAWPAAPGRAPRCRRGRSRARRRAASR